ncbi:MAG: tetratricopeptide repeat protein [Myxococcota bacterium]|nr:tetratricopeptide repeat protein [Myxococcota bacterium]
MACPADETFSAFVSGSLGESARDALEVHVDGCATCRMTLSELGRAGIAVVEKSQLPAIDERVGRYAITGELGAGAMGVVYRARDPELDREVAIKLVQPQAGAPEDELVRQRMLREGRALARIDHPNVVRVFDVGRWHGALFVAMEHAPGTSLRAWLGTARSQAAIIDVFVQCARGLAAAHAAGVIHRDFKPDNVVVDEAGHARVMDFGLAQTDADAADDVATTPARFAIDPSELRLTRTRGILGTPAYMAPEQHRAEAIDARADQFAWSVAFAEALGGTRPFTADTHDDLIAAMRAKPDLPPGIPRRVRRVLERGLAFAPADRFSTMTAAAAGLAPRRVWPWLAAIAAAIAIGGALFVLRDRDPCADVDTAMGRVWTTARGERIAAQFAAVQRPFADRAWSYARGAVGRYTEDWKTARVGVCRAGVERGEIDAATRGRIVHCLERRVVELDAILARWETGGIESAPQMIDRLAPIDRCAASDAAPPATAAERTQLRAFEARFAAANVAADAGQPLEAEPLLAALDRELAATPHHGLRAEVLTRLANVSRDLGKRDAARTHLIAALAAAETARSDRTRARAWIALAANAAEDFSRMAEARDSLRLASAVLANLGEPTDLARLHDATRGIVALNANEPAEAIAALRRSMEGTLPATERATRTQMLSRALIAAGDHAGALVELDRAEKLLVDALGPDAPQLVFVLNSSMEALEYLGRPKDAVARGERALALLEASYGKDNPRRTQLLGNLASMYASAGDKPRARALEAEVVVLAERQFGADAEPTAVALLNLASTLNQLGEHEKAIEHLDRAKVIFTKVLGADAAPIANVHSGLYEAHGKLGRPALALQHAERSLAIREAGNTPPGYLAYSRIELAEALWEAGEKSRAIALAKSALELPLGTTGREGELVTQIRAWLAAHARP